MYVAWFSVSNFVTACLLPYVQPYDQGVMQRCFDGGIYALALDKLWEFLRQMPVREDRRGFICTVEVMRVVRTADT